MTKYTKIGCCACATGAYPCAGDQCPNLQDVPHYCCDDCGEEKTLYLFDGGELCLDCIFDSLPKKEAEFCEVCGEADEIRWFDGKQLCKVCAEEKLQEGGCYGEF